MAGVGRCASTDGNDTDSGFERMSQIEVDYCNMSRGTLEYIYWSNVK